MVEGLIMRMRAEAPRVTSGPHSGPRLLVVLGHSAEAVRRLPCL
jgi:hypothetical protein